MIRLNRYGTETLAREERAEIEQLLRQATEVWNVRPSHRKPRLKYRWIAVAATALSIVGAIASVVIVHAR